MVRLTLQSCRILTLIPKDIELSAMAGKGNFSRLFTPHIKIIPNYQCLIYKTHRTGIVIEEGPIPFEWAVIN